jgi:ribosomal protein L13
VPESEREGVKTGPFADFDNPTVTKDGKVADAKGTIIGRLIQGDAKMLFGKPVDSDGDVLE